MVILIIAAIAIPNLVHGKMRANEAAAVASVKAVDSAQAMYVNAYPEIGYASNLINLGPNGTTCEKPSSTAACLIMDESLANGMKSGYLFEIVGDGNKPSGAYVVSATPESSLSGRCTVSSNQGGELRLSIPGSTVTVGGRSVSNGGSGCDL